ncbi:MAG TPA: hypothetical protein PK092_13940 [Chitinophagaceae bacterium]|nr:hypothetical protein [Chitinophagaceae bacterium]
MTKFIVLFTIMALRLGYHPASATKENTPFASLPVHSEATNQQLNPLNIISITGYVSNNKVILDWQVGQNEKADQFLVEKSTDGKTFKMAALVFSSEKSDKENYQFYEKAGNGKCVYRVLLISKDKQSVYSPAVELDTDKS